MRTLASIKTIQEIKPIPDAEKICAYRVDGWWVVDAIGKYSVNDYVVYIEIDSWVPHKLAPFLSKGKEPREFNGVKGERLKTIRLRGQISQGLLLHRVTALDLVGEIYVDMDVTELLGIQKWEPPADEGCISGQAKGSFPSQIPKTDQTRIQSIKKSQFEAWKDSNILFEVTEKLEGSSCTIAIIDDEFHVCSRNISLKNDESIENVYWKIANKYDLENKMRNLGLNNIAIQGEIVGHKIQGNIYNLTDVEFYVFDVYSCANDVGYFNTGPRYELCGKLGLKHIPITGFHTLRNMDVEKIIDMANGKSRLNSNVLREGIVFKALDSNKNSIGFKSINNEYLLKG